VSAPTSRRRTLTLVVALLVACTDEPSSRTPPGATPAPAPSKVAPGPAFPVVMGSRADDGFLEGMRLAASELGFQLDVRKSAGAAVDTLREAVASEPPTVFVVGQAQAVTAARPEIEAAGVPVVVLGGDLYTPRLLFRYAFQTSIPLRWQARVLSRYLVVDRSHERIAIVGEEAIGAEALAEEGVSPWPSTEDADAVLALGRRAVTTASPRGQLASSADALGGRQPPPGTVTCYPYTWAGWADMLSRVHRFRQRFERAVGHPPGGFEQEGYDAVRAVAEGLERTGGRGGENLVRALESFREETFSALPIRLGPDDHVFAEESQLGLFSVAAPDERAAPGEAIGAVPWRPIMRTFTTDGQKVNLLDRDKKVFFPGWHRRKPSPRYWKSRYGIVTRPDEDPLH
jgi:hypothetical protein